MRLISIHSYIGILVTKTIENIWVSAAHAASYNFISLTFLCSSIILRDH